MEGRGAGQGVSEGAGGSGRRAGMGRRGCRSGDARAWVAAVSALHIAPSLPRTCARRRVAHAHVQVTILQVALGHARHAPPLFDGREAGRAGARVQRDAVDRLPVREGVLRRGWGMS